MKKQRIVVPILAAFEEAEWAQVVATATPRPAPQRPPPVQLYAGRAPAFFDPVTAAALRLRLREGHS